MTGVPWPTLASIERRRRIMEMPVEELIEEVRLMDEMVHEETGEKRAVLGACRNCAKTWPTPKPEHFTIISATGVAHVGAEYGLTACGKDATGPNWWWPI